MYKFDTLGVMIDMSRNAVMSPEGLKRYILILAKMGYNTVMLYTEDTYEVTGEPYFGYLRGRYTKDELKELDAFSADLGIELIPCIQTLAHLNATLRWSIFPVDADDIMLVGEERCYELIDRMLSSCAECFRSRRIHIGMDEAHGLGKGQYLDKHGYETVDSIMKKHLARVVEITDKNGFNPLMWSDMLFKGWTNGEYCIGKREVPKEYIDALPPSVSPVFWDYFHTAEDVYDNMIYNHKQFKSDVWFAGGAWTWTGVAPHNDFTLESMIPALKVCRKYKVKNVFFTMWGDNGGECSRFAVLPSLFYLAEVAKGHTDEQKIKAKFKRLTGVDFDTFMLLDTPNHISLPDRPNFHNPSKYMLYSDCFNGFLDWTVEEGVGATYARYAEALRAAVPKSRRYGYLFDTQAKLCSLLEVKYELGVKTRAAYKAGDKDELLRLATEDYTKAIKRTRLFAAALEKQWMAENKPQGFEVQDIRLGGLIRRLEHCRRDLLEYVGGKKVSVPELEQDILPFGAKGQSMVHNRAHEAFTVNPM